MNSRIQKERPTTIPKPIESSSLKRKAEDDISTPRKRLAISSENTNTHTRINRSVQATDDLTTIVMNPPDVQFAFPTEEPDLELDLNETPPPLSPLEESIVRAQYLLKLKKYCEAEELINCVLGENSNLSPRYKKALNFVLGLAYQRQGKYKEAERIYLREIEKPILDCEKYYIDSQLIRLYLKLNNPSSAVQVAQRALMIPNLELEQKEELSEALKKLNSILKCNSGTYKS